MCGKKKEKKTKKKSIPMLGHYGLRSSNKLIIYWLLVYACICGSGRLITVISHQIPSSKYPINWNPHNFEIIMLSWAPVIRDSAASCCSNIGIHDSFSVVLLCCHYYRQLVMIFDSVYLLVKVKLLWLQWNTLCNYGRCIEGSWAPKLHWTC